MDKGRLPADHISRRAGRFSLDAEWATENLEEVLDLLAVMRVLITRCEHIYHMGELQYVGLSQNFRPLKKGESTPFYTFTFEGKDGVPTLGKVEVDPKR